jgi:hypothetical protein
MPTGRYDLIKCGLCGRAFVYEVGSRPTCPDCAAEEDALYRKIRSLIADYPERRMSVAEVSRLLKVEEKKVSYLVDCGMFSLVSGVGLFDKRSDD